MLISTALDAFFDIFSEDYYNEVLAKCQVIQEMAKGVDDLRNLYQHNKSNKLMEK